MKEKMMKGKGKAPMAQEIKKAIVKKKIEEKLMEKKKR